MSQDGPVSATIIPFPRARPPAANDAAQERLKQALAGLDQALTRQREAIAAWRRTLGELNGVVSGLGESLHRYRGSLDRLGTSVAGLHVQATQLERTADAALKASIP